MIKFKSSRSRDKQSLSQLKSAVARQDWKKVRTIGERLFEAGGIELMTSELWKVTGRDERLLLAAAGCGRGSERVGIDEDRQRQAARSRVRRSSYIDALHLARQI